MPRAKPAAAAPGVAAPAAHTEKRSRGNVIIACRMPVSGIELQLCDMRIVSENTQTGSREVKQFFKVGKKYLVVGTAYPRGQIPPGFPDKPPMVNGYALTRGVPADFWDEWKEQNKLDPMVVNNHIFAYPDIDRVRGVAKENKGAWTGFEPMTLTKTGEGEKVRYTDPRIARPTLSGVSPLQVEEDRAKAVERAEQAEQERDARVEELTEREF